MWELEERHLQEKHQLLKQQLKDQYFMQRHQLLKRHEKVRLLDSVSGCRGYALINTGHISEERIAVGLH